jgi:hypothetical protein
VTPLAQIPAVREGGDRRTQAAGGGTILFTGGGWADHPAPAWGTVSLGKAAWRPAATMLGTDLAGDGIGVASITIAGQIQPGTPSRPGHDHHNRSLHGLRGIPLAKRIPLRRNMNRQPRHTIWPGPP